MASSFLQGLGGFFGGGGQAIDVLLRLREQQRDREAQQERFEQEMEYRRNRDQYERSRDLLLDRRYDRGQISDERRRREEQIIKQINERGGSIIGDPSEIVSDMLPIRRGEPENVAAAVGAVAPAAAPGLQAALESARTARQEGAVDLARKLAEARQRAQATQRTQQLEDEPIVVDPNQIFNPAGMASTQAQLSIDDYRRRREALDQAINFMGKEPGIAMLRGDLFALPADKQREALAALNRVYANMVSFSRYYGVDPKEIITLALAQEGIDPSLINRVSGQTPSPAGPRFSNPFDTGGGGPQSPPAAAPSGGPTFTNPFAPPATDSTSIRRSSTSTRGPIFTNPFEPR